ncbi:hypothetical protein EV361DRAFT_291033 [Lentinula raphanica]|nr:hypothetical protein EV361DRAFT_291033 [Lentinula raphanica]
MRIPIPACSPACVRYAGALGLLSLLVATASSLPQGPAGGLGISGDPPNKPSQGSNRLSSDVRKINSNRDGLRDVRQKTVKELANHQYFTISDSAPPAGVENIDESSRNPIVIVKFKAKGPSDNPQNRPHPRPYHGLELSTEHLITPELVASAYIKANSLLLIHAAAAGNYLEITKPYYVRFDNMDTAESQQSIKDAYMHNFEIDISVDTDWWQATRKGKATVGRSKGKSGKAMIDGQEFRERVGHFLFKSVVHLFGLETYSNQVGLDDFVYASFPREK